MGGMIWIAAGVVLAVASFALGRTIGRRSGFASGHRRGREQGLEAGRTEARAEVDREVRLLVEALSRGSRPHELPPGSLAARVLPSLEQGWAPRDQERQRALREAVGRVSAFLHNAVRAPLAGATPSADAGELRERIERALGAMQDLDFFAKEPVLEVAVADLSRLVRQVAQEFARDQGVGVRLSLDDRPVRARVNETSFLDALYLVLHNAARFGGGATVDVSALLEGGLARIRVRDRGAGFTPEGLARAFEPFYSTAEDGLGLGLPHARRVIEGMGGRIDLGNASQGGGEVEISFPAA